MQRRSSGARRGRLNWAAFLIVVERRAYRGGTSKVERIKAESDGLRGTIARELGEPTPRFSEENVQLLKFHGIYQQEDRDQRKATRGTGAPKPYAFMVRTKNPGG